MDAFGVLPAALDFYQPNSLVQTRPKPAAPTDPARRTRAAESSPSWSVPASLQQLQVADLELSKQENIGNIFPFI